MTNFEKRFTKCWFCHNDRHSECGKQKEDKEVFTQKCKCLCKYP